jgi:5-methyltetrahydrofolate--homocysteine methyltransferase
VDVKTAKFMEALSKHPDAFVGLSALLTTTMGAMESTNKALKEAFPHAITFIGGAPVSDKFREQIGADYYSADPQGLVEILNKLVA